MRAKVIWTLAENRTPDLGLGFPKKAATVASKVKDLLPTWKVDLEEEDIHSEPPLVIGTGNPRVFFTIPGPVPGNYPYPLWGYG